MSQALLCWGEGGGRLQGWPIPSPAGAQEGLLGAA